MEDVRVLVGTKTYAKFAGTSDEGGVLLSEVRRNTATRVMGRLQNTTVR